jgi:hypothetical protein
MQSPLQILLKQYSSNPTKLLQAPDDPAILNPFLTKYKWLSILKGLSPIKVRDWVSSPRDRNPIFEKLEEEVDRYYEKIRGEMDCLDVDCHTTTLRWINSTKEYVFIQKIQ